jgi:curli biogenesis system outer membrane secretion channel CsgG
MMKSMNPYLRGFAIVMVLCMLLAVVGQSHDAQAQLFGKKKKDNLDKDADGVSGDEQQAEAGSFTGPKKIIAVSSFKSGGQIAYDTGAALSAMLSESLMATGKFIVVERTEVDSLIGEQNLGADGRTTSQTAAKVGSMLGTSILVMGTVTQFEEGAASSGGGIGFGGVNIGGGKTTAYVKINIRLVDTSTGRILSTHNADGTATGKSASGGANVSGVSLSGSKSKKTPIGQAAQDAIDQAVAHLDKSMKDVPFVAKVADISGEDIYINAGSLRNMEPGMVLKGFKTVKEITDPDTGLALDVIEEETGSVEIVSVREKLSIAKKVSGSIENLQVLRLE